MKQGALCDYSKMITPLGADINPYYTVMSVQSPQWIIL